MVSVRAASCGFAFVAAHALTSKASEQECREWWSELPSALRRAPSNCSPVLLIDANAHFEWRPAPPSPEAALNCNAFEFCKLMDAHQMVATPNMTQTGVRVHSWIGPMQQPKCLDFIACASALQQGLEVLGCIDSFEGQNDLDHRPVVARLRFCKKVHQHRHRRRLDTKAMLTAQGRAKLRRIYDSMPQFPWELPADQHLKQLNDHLLQELAKAFPAQPHLPRSPVIQPSTWLLVQDRSALRRELHTARLNRDRHLLAVLFGAWAGRCREADQGLAFLHEALLVTQLRDLSSVIRRKAREDTTAAAQALIHEARAQGPEQLYHAFRQVLKQGRRYRPAALCPCIEGQEEHEGDAFLMLGRNFARAERAEECEATDIVAQAVPAPAPFLEMGPELTLSALAHGYGQLQPRKAAGVSGIPPEALCGDALGAWDTTRARS